MARQMSSVNKDRPVLQPIKSFTRFEPPETPKSSRLRASTVQGGASVQGRNGTSYTSSLLDPSSLLSPQDVFDKKSLTSPMPNLEQSISRAQSLPAHFDELPVELASLTDR